MAALAALAHPAARRLPPHTRPGLRRHARAASALALAAERLRDDLLAACAPDPVQTSSGSAPALSKVGPADWSAVRAQAAAASAWRTHPLQPRERLAVAEALCASAADVLRRPAEQAVALCRAYQHLLAEDALFKPRSAGVGRCALVRLGAAALAPAACHEAAAFLLAGYAVTLAAPQGDAYDAAVALAEGFPVALLQAAEDATGAPAPDVVDAVRCLGGHPPRALWAAHEPPDDFGGTGDDGERHGLAGTAALLSLARTDVPLLATLPRSRYALSPEAADLASLLSTSTTVEVPSVAGLPPPRWARSAYDRGVEEVHDLLDLLWSFQCEAAAGDEGDLPTAALAAAPKHLLLTVSSDVPEQIAKAAVVAAMSPFREPITLHAVGLGARGLAKDPLRGFCRLVQSGRSNLEWRVQEHASPDAFLEWLGGLSEEDGLEAPTFFGVPPRAIGAGDFRRLAACAGGAALADLFPPEPLEQLRRWTRVATTSGTQPQRYSPLVRPEAELLYPRPVADDD